MAADKFEFEFFVKYLSKHCHLDGKVDAVICSAGTGGTLAGVSMYLKEKNSRIRTVLADPPVNSLYERFFSHVSA